MRIWPNADENEKIKFMYLTPPLLEQIFDDDGGGGGDGDLSLSIYLCSIPIRFYVQKTEKDKQIQMQVLDDTPPDPIRLFT